MGSEADVSFEGGTKIIPSPDPLVRRNIEAITSILAEEKADVYLLQELSSGSLLNHWYNLRRAVTKTLKKHSYTGASNFSLPLYFDVLRNEHGMGTYIRPNHAIIERKIKPFTTGEYYYKVIPRWDYAVMTGVSINNTKIAFINSHLSSFDKQGVIRQKQFSELMKFARSFYKRGYKIVIGADWNMTTGDASYYGDDKNAYKDYVYPFPTELLPEKWTTHFPLNGPTLRAANRPYIEHASTTAVIDGFVCSPGISVEHVKTLNKDFEHSDHNPVELVICCV